MARTQHPGIFQLGRVHQAPDGATVVAGWGLSLCPSACSCHRHPYLGQLQIAENQAAGTLGLASFTPTPCGCCTPWHADELAAVLRDLASAAALASEPKGESCPPPAP